MSPLKGRQKEARLNKQHPKAQTSIFNEYGSCQTNSGAIKRGVPTLSLSLSFSQVKILDTPKSPILTERSFAKRIFKFFRSR